MNPSRLASALLLNLVGLAAGLTAGETAGAAVMKTLYVSPAGNDANPGTQDQPSPQYPNSGRGSQDQPEHDRRHRRDSGRRHVLDFRADRVRPSRLGHRRPQDRLSRCRGEQR